MHQKRTPKILVADDCSVITAIIANCLEQISATVKVVDNGRDAWSLAQHERFDLVITDEEMQHLSGLELCGLLRQQEAHADVPIVFITGKALSIDPDEFTELRITEILYKPFSPRQLVSIVNDRLATGTDTLAGATAAVS
jgi:CheY-like chemotaxis protein